MSALPPDSSPSSAAAAGDPLHGLDPDGLLAAAALPADSDATRPLPRADLPALAEIATAFPELEILDPIGHGGMSAVFKARQPKLDRFVALKVLPKALAATPGFAERFHREGRVLARLSHPSIVAVHDFGESGGFAFLIMEFVDGVNLRQAMRAGRFTPEQALAIVPALCDALQFAHSHGVLHRDIKPENILLDSKGRVKIADFGIAKIVGEEGGEAMLLTQSGAKLGTAPYMAPEQIEQPGSVDHRADIYSLGVVFYEMLTGELPLGRFAAPSTLASVGGNLDEVVLRALEKERARRQQSADEFKTQVAGAGAMPPRRRQPKPGEPFEYKSKRTLFGLPLLHVVSGRDPETGKAREARGFIAIGDKARGVFAFGGIARGWFAFGGLAFGVVAFGGVGIGLISISGLAIGLLFACGGVALGLLALGGLALGYHTCGPVVAGWHGMGGIVLADMSHGGSMHEADNVKNPQLVLPLTRWLISWAPNIPLLAIVWLPISAFIWCAYAWARQRVAAEAAEAPPESASARIFWLVPAITVVTVALCWLVYALARSAMPQTSWFLIPTLGTVAGLLLFSVAVPLWLRLVPVNSIFGVRLPSTMRSESRWYEVNAVFGRHLFWWALLVTGAGVAGFYQLPRHQDAYAWGALSLVLVAVAGAILSMLVWIRHHPEGREPVKPHRLMRNLELVLPVLVLMFFVRSFIARSYVVPHGNEPGVAKNSRWIATHLNAGFAPGALVAYAHENGQTWLARVVAVEVKGLRLKRGGKPEEFFMPWDKIIGRMLFSFLSPSAAPKP